MEHILGKPLNLCLSKDECTQFVERPEESDEYKYLLQMPFLDFEVPMQNTNLKSDDKFLEYFDRNYYIQSTSTFEIIGRKKLKEVLRFLHLNELKIISSMAHYSPSVQEWLLKIVFIQVRESKTN